MFQSWLRRILGVKKMTLICVRQHKIGASLKNSWKPKQTISILEKRKTEGIWDPGFRKG